MTSDGSLRVSLLSEKRFMAMAEEWQACLSGSDANPLFMSWAWLYSWWETWSQIMGLELVLFGVFDEQDTLVGIGPFYRRDLVTPFGLRVQRLHLIGSAWRFAATVRTEYCGLILNRQRAGAIGSALIENIAQWHWDEWVLCDIVDKEQRRLIQQLGNLSHQTIEVLRMQDEGIRVDTSGDFGQWQSSLGRNTRLKAYNRRDYLRRIGKLECVNVDSSADAEFLDRLNAFHVGRWGKSAFEAEAVRFHRRFMARLPSCGGRLSASQLLFDGYCVSVLYDVTIGGQRFNLQSGYLEHFDRKVSLGSLHLGFAIEAAFRDQDTRCYDLLAGGGKQNYYKHRFQGETVEFRTVQLVRRPGLRFLYRMQAGLPNGWRRGVNRWFRL